MNIDNTEWALMGSGTIIKKTAIEKLHDLTRWFFCQKAPPYWRRVGGYMAVSWVSLWGWDTQN
jgi:hypothetical protein